MGDEILHVSLTIDEEVVESIKKDLDQLTISRREGIFHKIDRVLHSDRKINGESYDPQIISIGPYHRKNVELRSMEEVKLLYLRDLINWSPKTNTVEKYTKVITEFDIGLSRNYYSKPVELNDREFTQMLVLDGCFLIEFLVKSYLDENTRYFSEVIRNLPIIRRDLMLFENQLPFPILQLLFDNSEIPVLRLLAKSESEKITLMHLAVSYVTENQRDTLRQAPRDDAENQMDILPQAPRDDALHHILHVSHACMLPPPCIQKKFERKGLATLLPRMKNLLRWIFYFFFYVLTGHNPWRTRPKGSLRYDRRVTTSIPIAGRLVEHGVMFEAKKTRGMFDLLNVSFDKETGIMEIPTLLLEERVISLFSNMIAFEQSNDQRSGDHFTSYANFMNILIQFEENVKILEEKEIIVNKQAKPISEVFSNLATETSLISFMKQYLYQVSEDVEEYCNVSHRRWRAELMPYYNYFKRPWAIFSIVVSVFLLIPTLVQTFYAVYAYYRPPN